MSLNPQYTYDAMGNKIGVFLPIDEYERLTGNYGDSPVEQWERDLISKRMEDFHKNPEAGIPWTEVRQQMIDEDGQF